MEYAKGTHCKYLIALHIILVVKYRKKLLIGSIGQATKKLIVELSLRSDFEIEQVEVDKDRLNMLIRITPKYAVSQHIRRIKQYTTKHLWNNYPTLRRQFWKEQTFWSDGYFVCSIGNASAETVRKYIQE
jgi:putative transposase